MNPGWSRFFLDSLKSIDSFQRRRTRTQTFQEIESDDQQTAAHTTLGSSSLRDCFGSKINRRIDFGSNDYLGLRSAPQVLACLQTAELSSFGAGSSPVLTGYTKYHAQLEAELADFSQSAAALVFSSGYACHVGVVACLAGLGDLILSDALNHASLIDGCRLSRATKKIYPHNDADYVRQTLQADRHRFDKVLLLTESIFSMDGDAAPLVDLASLAEEFDCGLVVDEAHATGVYGRLGSGLLEELGLQNRVLAKLGTLSKAIGSIGGYACGERQLIEYLVNTCRSYLFSTSPPAANMIAARTALELLQSRQAERAELRQLSMRLRNTLIDFRHDVPVGDSPIVPLIVGSEEQALCWSESLLSRGIYVPAIRPPTVPEGTARLRISLRASHTSAELSELIAALEATRELHGKNTAV